MPQDVGEVGALVQSLLPPLVFVLGLVLILGMGVEGRLSVSAASPAHSREPGGACNAARLPCHC